MVDRGRYGPNDRWGSVWAQWQMGDWLNLKKQTHLITKLYL